MRHDPGHPPVQGWRSIRAESVVVPADACVDLILREDTLTLIGPSTSWIRSRPDAEHPTLGVRIQAGSAAAILGHPLSELRDRRLPAAEVIGRDAADRWRAALAPGHGRGLPCPGLAAGPTPAWVGPVRGAAAGGVSAREVVRLLGWSERTFRRQMGSTFGMGYATLGRVLRAQRALSRLRAGTPPARVAQETGYADQPHLSRELRRVAGVSPAQVLDSSAKRSTELPSGSSTVA